MEQALSSSLYSNLEELVEFRFHVKQKKLNHQQNMVMTNSGNHLITKKGQGMTFSEVRQYHPGDDIRHIDWKVTARTQKPHTKMFVEEHERPTILAIEQTPNLFFGSQVRLKTAQALNIAAILGWISLTHNERVGGVSFNHHQNVLVTPKRDQQNLLNLFQKSIDLQAQLKAPKAADIQAWPDALNQLLKASKPGNKIFLIGDMMQLAKHASPQLHKLNKTADITAIHIYDELEKTLPELGWLSITSSFNSNQLVKLDSFRKKTRAAYQEIYDQQWQDTIETFAKLYIPLVDIGTHEAPLLSLIEHKLLQ